MNGVSLLEGWGFVAFIVVCGAIGYLTAAALRQFYEDRDEPKWLKLLAYVLTTIGVCGGAVLAVLALLNHW